MKAFTDPILLSNGRLIAHCLTVPTEVCGVRPSFLTIIDLQQNDDEGMPKVIFQQDMRDVKSLEAVKRQIAKDLPGTFTLGKKEEDEDSI